MLLFFTVNKVKSALTALEQISDIQSEVLKFLFQVGHDGVVSKASYEQAAQHFNLTAEAIEAIEAGALRSLRRSKIN